MVDNCTRQVYYNSEKMWFNYQALFDKTKNKVLGKIDNIKVKHTDFDKNVIAREAMFYNDKVDINLLNEVSDGDLNIQAYIQNNL